MPTYDARLVGRNVTVLSAGTHDFLANYESASIRVTTTTANVTSVMDSGERYRTVHYNWQLTVRSLKTASSAWFTELVAGRGGEMTFSMTDSEGGREISGNIICTDLGNTFDVNAQVDDLTFQGTGDLYIDGLPYIIEPVIEP